MDPLQQITHWLNSKGNYPEGVMLYQKLGADQYLKTSLFCRPCNSFIYDRLRSELQKIKDTYRPVMEAPIIQQQSVSNAPIVPNTGKLPTPDRGLSIDDFFNLPQELQRHRLSISALFSEVISFRMAIRRELNLPTKGTITLQEAFHQMSQLHNDKGVPCKLLWITYNEQTGKAGRIMEYEVVLKFGNRTGSKFKVSTPANSDRRDPRHDIHGTCNVQLTGTLEIRTVHTWLIFQCNGFDVTITPNG